MWQVIVDSYDKHHAATKSRGSRSTARPYIVPISANTRPSLQNQVSEAVDYARRTQNKSADLVYTLACRRQHLPYRAFAIINGTEKPSLSSYIKVSNKVEGVTMLFSGQGAQWPRMGSELMNNPQFQADIEEMDEILQSFTHRPHWTIKGIGSCSVRIHVLRLTRFSGAPQSAGE